MKYSNYHIAKFVKKINRFTVICELDGQEIIVHLKNTGRNVELLVPGYEVSVVHNPGPKRKTDYDLVAVNKLGHWINIDSQAPNAVVKESLAESLSIPGVPKLVEFKPETKIDDSRIDFWGLTADKRNCWIETKGVTLEMDGIAKFPDAPTTRAVKHVKTMTNAVKNGDHAYLYFVVQMDYVSDMTINLAMAPKLAAAINDAVRRGVHVVACDCVVTPGEMKLRQVINFK
ncbi:DNA/RNA nuclease SfsA [Lentilactobacillus sp. Marseille-Q4993]|uniref:DNA/RNA nuclease SfsA n=1 Tax=Lentilactobacillus sp. Marseille-Q4993 TaxID=3039492 RepID=UPI0024BCA163|nr:DNA/RNA nuclease SfsA [Lentilactobacillus sp. Marseille-Q4993]